MFFSFLTIFLTFDNPTMVQAIYAIRQMLVIGAKGITPSLMGNCTVLADVDANEDNERNDDPDLEDGNTLIELWSNENSRSVTETISEDRFRQACLAYITGYIVVKIVKRVSCSPYENALFHNDADPLNSDIISALKLRDPLESR